MGDAVKGLLSIFTGGKKPKPDRQPVEDIQSDARKARKSRTALVANEGGLAGQELSPDQVQSRSTLLGN